MPIAIKDETIYTSIVSGLSNIWKESKENP
jgi:hypothetical protein